MGVGDNMKYKRGDSNKSEGATKVTPGTGEGTSVGSGSPGTGGTGVFAGTTTGAGGAAITGNVVGMQVAVVILPAIQAKPPFPPGN